MNKKCSSSVKRNSGKWIKTITSLKNSCKSRKNSNIVENSLGELNKLPTGIMIIGGCKYLSKTHKSRLSRIKIIAIELTELWKKKSFPIITMKSIERRVFLYFETV